MRKYSASLVQLAIGCRCGFPKTLEHVSPQGVVDLRFSLMGYGRGLVTRGLKPCVNCHFHLKRISIISKSRRVAGSDTEEALASVGPVGPGGASPHLNHLLKSSATPRSSSRADALDGKQLRLLLGSHRIFVSVVWPHPRDPDACCSLTARVPDPGKPGASRPSANKSLTASPPLCRPGPRLKVHSVCLLTSVS